MREILYQGLLANSGDNFPYVSNCIIHRRLLVKEQARRIRLIDVAQHPWILQYIYPCPEISAALVLVEEAYAQKMALLHGGPPLTSSPVH